MPPTRAILDPGWLFVLAGLGLIGATILIPAADDLAEARWLRDRALAVEAHRLQRIERYEAYLGALDERDPTLILSLAASQLHKIPADLEVVPQDLLEDPSASVFPGLEPPPLVVPPRREIHSALQRLTTDDTWRLLLLGAGTLAIALGLLGSRTR